MDIEKLIMSPARAEDVTKASAITGQELCLDNDMPASEMDNLLQDDTSTASQNERDNKNADGKVGGSFSRAKGLSAFSASGMIMLSIVLPISMPYALAQASLVGGVMLIILGAMVMLYMAMLVGRCWVIMMETWPDQYSHQKVRRVYPAIAKEAGGRFWEIATLISVAFTNFGAAVVMLLAAASMADVLLSGYFSVRILAVFGSIILLPLVCFGTMMDTWWLGTLGVPLTLSAGLTMLLAVILSKVYPENTISHPGSQIASHQTMMISQTNMTSSPWTMTSSPISSTGSAIPFQESGSTVTFPSFWIGLSTIVFALSPMSVMPTVQHDMHMPEHYTRAVLPAFTTSVLMCLSIGVVGVETFGQYSHPNTLSSVRCRSSPAVQVVGKISSVLNCIYSLGIVLLALIPLSQSLEEAVNLPASKSLKHC